MNAFEKEYIDQEWENSGFENAFRNAKTKHTASLKTGLIIPIRVNNLKNFAKDFFLPTTVNVAIKTNRLGLRIIAAFGSFLLDTITLPIRLVTVIPRSIAGMIHKNNETELNKCLLKNGVSKNLLSGDYIQVTTVTTHIFHDEPKVTDNPVTGIPTIHCERVPLRYVPMGALILNRDEKV